MVIKRADLLSVLKQCLPGVEGGNVTLEGADTFIFSGGSIYTYNDIMSVRVPITETGLIEEPLEGAVKASEFFNVINKLSGEEIKASNVDGKWLLKCGKAKIELNLINFDYKTRLSNVDIEQAKWTELPKDFQTCIGLCKMAGNRSSLSGVLCQDNFVLSTDGWQINKAVMEGTELPLFWVSDTAVTEILKLTGLKEMSITGEGSWAHFKTETGCIFSVKTLQAGKWPVSKLLGLLEEHQKTENDISGIFPKELFAAIDRASSFSMELDDYETVNLLLEEKGITVSAQRTAGKYSELVPWGENATPLNITEFKTSVSSTMMAHVGKRSLSFYIHTIQKGENAVSRIIFISDNSQHLLSTFQTKE